MLINKQFRHILPVFFCLEINHFKVFRIGALFTIFSFYAPGFILKKCHFFQFMFMVIPTDKGYIIVIIICCRTCTFRIYFKVPFCIQSPRFNLFHRIRNIQFCQFRNITDTRISPYFLQILWQNNRLKICSGNHCITHFRNINIFINNQNIHFVIFIIYKLGKSSFRRNV